MEEMHINWLALIVASIVPLVTGFVWYNPKTFGNAWMRETGMTEEKAKQMNMLKTYGLTVVLSFFVSFFLFVWTTTGGAPTEPHGTEAYMTFKHGAFHGALLALIIGLPVLGINALFEQKSFKYIAINVGYWILTMAIMGGIVNAWV
ncbi:DUF1761 domain-containing protein [Winogradskyella ursingii]|uniref:DUF1761 domain-containing protein n=1 Tax=Winogradskyella ursingii TaxID=2686079 RepID=UPI00293BB389|nr:DUF1761 domain-containing protein [Winogradskyella ursingii]